MDFDSEETDLLGNDPEFMEYRRAMEKDHKATDATPQMEFVKRNVEVTQAVFGDELLGFCNKVWLFSDKNVVYICDRCLHQYWDSTSLGRHRKECSQGIPGRHVYTDKDEGISVIEIDGECENVLCRRICTIGRAFIHRKTLHLDVDGYLFYVLLIGGRVAGFFSKEKESEKHNLSCLLVLPPHRSRGYGSLMIDLSYILGPGTPEKPLSKEGRAAYKRYWRNMVLKTLRKMGGEEMSICSISAESGLSIDDTIHGLELLGINPESHIYDVSGKVPVPLRECKKNCLIF
ncbi:histone acetyltransferase [Encephalitozoon cuniculi EcunIII-L]|nr:histone acetyltransferase [Encephalitozoon cuniculi EcunIII-L]